MEKLKRLKDVLEQIKRLGKDECNFEALERLRIEEYQLEVGGAGEYQMGNYRHNLEQTGWKQAESYKEASRRRPLKGASSEFREYVSHFTQDVSEELYKLSIK